MTTQDRLDIQQAIAEYSYTFDGRDADGWSKLFTEDAVWELFGETDSDPQIRLEGRSEILEWAEQRHGEIPKNITSYHHQSGIFFEDLTDDSARTRAMVIITAHDNSEQQASVRITLTGVYHDVWRKTADGWRFEHRVLRV